MKIEGLKNDVQAYILTKMWECKSNAELKKWQASLSPEMKRESEALRTLMIIESIDYDTQQEVNFPLAMKVLQNM